jgi:hypothetical protein
MIVSNLIADKEQSTKAVAVRMACFWFPFLVVWQ